jgi:polyphosphate kinase 2
MNKFESDVDGKDWLDAELADMLDEDYELELSEPALREEIRKIYNKTHPPTVERTQYFRHLLALQAELIKLQAWVKHTKAKIIAIFEGRDAAGKGGVIKRITQRLNPRVCRVVALPAPIEREKTQWYFERYVPHLPAGGEIVLFDRSWYNRAGVERVMGFATPEQVEAFFRDVPEFERMLVRSGIILIKYWFSITDEEQHLRFLMRIHDPLKQWKLSRWTCSRVSAGRTTPRPRRTCSLAPTFPSLRGSSSRLTTRNERGSIASTTCCTAFPTRRCHTRRSRCRAACVTRIMNGTICRLNCMSRKSTERMRPPRTVNRAPVFAFEGAFRPGAVRPRKDRGARQAP